MNEGIHNQLNKVQLALNAPKNQLNKFGGYNFRSCEDILEAVKKVLPMGATITISDKIEMIGERYYIQATATFNFNGNSISTTAYAREPLEKKGYDVSQITGAASSYARKYALNGLFSIDDSKDSDATNDHAKGYAEPKIVSSAPKPSQEPLKEGVVADAYRELLSFYRANDMLAAAELIKSLTDHEKRKFANMLSPEQLQWVKSLSKNPVKPVPDKFKYAQV